MEICRLYVLRICGWKVLYPITLKGTTIKASSKLSKLRAKNRFGNVWAIFGFRSFQEFMHSARLMSLFCYSCIHISICTDVWSWTCCNIQIWRYGNMQHIEFIDSYWLRMFRKYCVQYFFPLKKPAFEVICVEWPDCFIVIDSYYCATQCSHYFLFIFPSIYRIEHEITQKLIDFNGYKSFPDKNLSLHGFLWHFHCFHSH